MDEGVVETAAAMVAAARETLSQPQPEEGWETRRPAALAAQRQPPAMVYKVTTRPPPSTPTSAPAPVTKAWVADTLVEVLDRVLTIERHAAGIRHSEAERRIEALERRINELTGEGRTDPPALRVVGE